LVAAAGRRSRTLALLVAATALQSAALYVLAKRGGAERPYQALKMVFLAIYPLAIAGALAIAFAVRRVWNRMRHPAIAWAPAIVVAVLVGRSVAHAPKPAPVVTQPLYEAGLWTRANLPVDCIDYLVAHDYSAYWLHHAVLRNPRADPKKSDDLFEAKQAIVRWVLPNGRTYAIAQDLEAVPRDARRNVEILATFGHAAVVKRRGPSSCR
jgi:hypothetical protein